jgi:Domain of unknown function (DUF397)
MNKEDRKVPLQDKNWRKSSYSSVNGSCVEVRQLPDVIEVRDTKDRTGPVLSFSADSWKTFVASVHMGDFDR